MASKKSDRIQRLFNELERKAPSNFGRPLGWIRRPQARLARIPLGILLVLGGIFSFLPVLGIWMLPLGLLLLAIDVPALQGPVSRTVIWGKRKWQNWQRQRRAKRSQ
ncbi:hypothetical protein [Paradevosia shaoguanensis]|uniref:hypothetical protein n=1 Tax=Paradevosia shaoguanensis TaxID=1335043 RepID=UPI000455C4D3|nr:hypothetical protein JP74_22380 [Devosia sp. 17-2-E-8]QMV01894.1 hypothetical protein GHV40_10580 [Devosia sp. D6-9]CDP51050.1 hypothetical protein [Devosia sp. DBB001]